VHNREDKSRKAEEMEDERWKIDIERWNMENRNDEMKAEKCKNNPQWFSEFAPSVEVKSHLKFKGYPLSKGSAK
jgi:hypothetical protein